MSRRTRILLLALAPALLPGCADDTARGPAPVEAASEAEHAETVLRADAGGLTAVEELGVTVEVRPAEGWQVGRPDFAEQLAPDWFVESTAREALLGPEGAPAGERFRLVVEPLRTGALTLGPLTIDLAATDPSAGADAVAAVETGSVNIDVAAVEAVAAEGFRGPAAPPREIAWWALLAAAAAALAAGLAVVALTRALRRAREARLAPVEVPAHRVALARLDELEARGLADGGEHERLVEEASHILRRYIEDAFALRAPERTTEEFLVESKRSAAFGPGESVLLEEFLRTSDLIKFAGLRADRTQADEALVSVRRFVERTASAERRVTMPRDAARELGVQA